MAVVFISPKKRQRSFLLGIAMIFIFLMIIIFVGVIFSKPKKVEPTIVYNSTKVNIDMSVFDSEKFTNLQPFPTMDYQYSYTAKAQNKQVRTGFISAESLEAARKILTDRGFTNIALDIASIGRDNPFVPYYEIPRAPTPTPESGSSTPPVQ